MDRTINIVEPNTLKWLEYELTDLKYKIEDLQDKADAIHERIMKGDYNDE